MVRRKLKLPDANPQDFRHLTRELRNIVRVLNAEVDATAAANPLDTDMRRLFDGSVVETIGITVTSAGGVITFTLDKNGGGNLTVIFAGKEIILDCTPPCTITLTAGTDTSPTLSYVYIVLTNGVPTLTVSTTGFPTTSYAPVATVLCQSAASLATDGAYKVHAWTDHINKSTENGHLSHIGAKLRAFNATWTSGCAGADLSSDAVTTTAGSIFQLHPHTMPALDTAVDGVWVVNDSDAAYTKITDFGGGGIDKTSDGSAITNNKWINIILWGVVSELEADCKLMINLPSAQYNLETDAQSDVDNTAEYSFPTEFVGTAFLIARYTLKYSTAGSGTYTQSQKTDLRGLEPSTSPGGGSITDHGQLAGLTDDDHTQYLLEDGTRALTGNMSVDAAITIDGVDISAHDHSGAGQGGTVDHTDLDNIGNTTHADLDAVYNETVRYLPSLDPSVISWENVTVGNQGGLRAALAGDGAVVSVGRVYFRIPQWSDLTTLKLHIHWSGSTAGSAAKWVLRTSMIDTTPSAGAGKAASANQFLDTAIDVPSDATYVAFNQVLTEVDVASTMTNLAAGEWVQLGITRLGTDGSDTYTGIIGVHTCHIESAVS